MEKLKAFSEVRRGFRQGETLSPFAFILGMEVLSQLFNEVVAENN